MTTKLDDILKERSGRYGDFADQARCAQELKTVCRRFREGRPMDPVIWEGLEMLLTKVSRMVCGDATYPDNWVDAAGYSQRTAEYLENKK